MSNLLAAGLTSAESEQLLREYGPNSLPRGPSRSTLARIGGQLRDPMILLLLGACAVTIILRDATDTAVILAVVVLNSALGVVQERRAERALVALDNLAAPTARVVRDDASVVVPAAIVVPGDVVHLDAGDIVPADTRVLESHRLQVNEAALTGESIPVERVEDDELSSGTVITRGRGVALVIRTGSDSALGRIAQLVASAPVRPTPLQIRLSRLSRQLVGLAAVASAVVFTLGVARGRSPGEMLVVAVSLAVAAVPESLPAVVSVALAMGAYRMALRSAIVRGLPAVETLGSVSVLASDKTGTLTEGRMVAREIWTPAGRYLLSGSGYSPEGAISQTDLDEGANREQPDRSLTALLRAIVLCNDASLVPPHGSAEWTSTGDPLEAALLAAASRGDIDPDQTRALWPRVAESPFDSQRRLMSTTHADARAQGHTLEVTKGAPESVFGLCTETEVIANARDAANQLTRDGLRVLAVAESEPGITGHRLLGLVAVSDPPRSTAKGVVQQCQDAGVRVVMVTGDHPWTAAAIARDVGIAPNSPNVVEGKDLADDDHEIRPDEVHVYARVHPEQKVDIVRALQQSGAVVAMTGDGVNDAPALRAADIGIAMGGSGTEVARQAADLILGDDDLGTVIVAVQEGRRILRNIRSFLRYALSGGIAEILVMCLGPFMGMPLPLLPAQILWINMLTHGLPGVAFGLEPLNPADMKRPSRSPDQSVLGGGLLRQVLLYGSLIGAVTLAAGGMAVSTDGPAQTYVFIVLGLAQLGVALALRVSRPHRISGVPWLGLAVLGAAGLQIAAIYLPVLQELLRTESIDAGWLAGLVLLASLPGFVVRGARRHSRTTRGRTSGRQRSTR
jgi:P-type Ca2+ transporter type 2C